MHVSIVEILARMFVKNSICHYLFNIFLTTLFLIHFTKRDIRLRYIRFAIKLILGHIHRNDEYRRIYLRNYKTCLHFDATFAPFSATKLYIYTRVYILRASFRVGVSNEQLLSFEEDKSSIKLLSHVCSLSRIAF